MARVADESGIPLVYVSTDYVFDGTLPLGQEYPVDAPVAPVGVYGQSKAAGEIAARSVAPHYIRTSWVVGNGKNFIEIMKSLAERGVNPTVVAGQYGRSTFTEDLAGAILHRVENRCDFGTYHVSNTARSL